MTLFLRPYGFKTGLAGDEMAGFVEFAGGKDISFSKEGYVTSGVLKNLFLGNNQMVQW